MANSLASCVSSLRSTNALLSSSISILDSGVNDFPRLAKILQTTRHFELLPEASLQTAQSNILASITPEMQSLLTKVEAHLDRLQRREQALQARSELLDGRIGEERRASNGAGGQSRIGAGTRESHSSIGSGGALSENRDVLRFKQLRRKKEALEYAVERLNLQAQQRQRQLRMSVAAR